MPEGATILDACNAAGVDTPTICYGDTLTPVNVCRVCVVELDGSRALVPSCSRPVEEGMVVHTDSDRVRHSRKMVLEFLATGVDLTQADELGQWAEHYGADPDRYVPRRRDHGRAGAGAGQPLYPRLRQVCAVLPLRGSLR